MKVERRIMDNSINEISKGRMKICSMYFPYRKKICLSIYDNHKNRYVKVATFNNDDAASWFMEYLAQFVGAKREDEVTE